MWVTNKCPVFGFFSLEQVGQSVRCNDALLLVAGCKSAYKLAYSLQAPRGIAQNVSTAFSVKLAV